MNVARNEPARAGGILSIAGVALLMLSIGKAPAQPGGGGRQGLKTAEQQAVWEIQAKGVAEDLKLGQVVESKLIAAYQAGRTSHDEAMGTLRSIAKANRMESWQQRRELAAKERGKLQKALTAFLSDVQTTHAIGILGSFNRRSDRMVHTLTEFKLEQEDLDTALEWVQTYVADSNKAREEAMASGDFKSIRESMRELKDKLDKDMATILTAEHNETWEETTEWRRRGGPGFGGGPGRNRRNH